MARNAGRTGPRGAGVRRALPGPARRHPRSRTGSPPFAALPAALVDPAGFDALPERELVYLLRSFSLATSDVLDAVDAERLRGLVDAMERRGLARAPDLRLAYDRLLAAREFDAARRYAAAHPDAELPALPQFLDATGPNPPAMSVWRPDADGAALQRTAFDPNPLQIVVTAGCHFSEDAARDISSDPVLGPLFAGHASWLMPPPGKEDQEALREWNRRFPAAQANQVYDRAEWTLLPPGWRMPGFFIVRDGKVVDHLFGWNPDGESRAALVAALQRAGLLPAPSSAAQGARSSNR